MFGNLDYMHGKENSKIKTKFGALSSKPLLINSFAYDIHISACHKATMTSMS